MKKLISALVALLLFILFIFFYFSYSENNLDEQQNKSQTKIPKISDETNPFLVKKIQGTKKVTKPDFIKKQITTLEKYKNFISKGVCESSDVDKGKLNDQYQAHIDALIVALNIAEKAYNLEELGASQIIKENEDSSSYQSKVFPNTVIARFVPNKANVKHFFTSKTKVSVVKRLEENFRLNGQRVELHYQRNDEGFNLTRVVVTNKAGKFQAITKFPLDYQVYDLENKQTAFGLTFSRIYPWLLTDMDIYDGELKRYWLYRGEKFCADRKGKNAKPFAIVEKTIEPSEYLLWYDGAIGTYPVKAMLKLEYANHKFVPVGMVYGYEKHKKLIILEEDKELKNTEEQVYNLNQSFSLNKPLKGIWASKRKRHDEFYIHLRPLYKALPKFVYKLKLKIIYAPDGSIERRIGQELGAGLEGKNVQTILFHNENNKPYLAYVDINYDGYLDLIVNDNFYLFDDKSKTFKSHSLDSDWFDGLQELGSYNIFNQSFTSSMSQAEIEYRSKNGKINPYLLSKYDLDSEVENSENFRYLNGAWVQKNKEPLPSYSLNVSDELNQKGALFNLAFINNTRDEISFKDMKLSVVLTNKAGEKFTQFLYSVDVLGTRLIDDNYVTFDGKDYQLPNTQFLPKNMRAGVYQFQVVLHHPKTDNIYSNTIQLKLPLKVEAH